MILGKFIKLLNQCGIVPGSSMSIVRHKMPLVRMPTITGGASGAITLAVALPEILPHCYGFFAEDSLEIGQPAGFYYVTMTTTTAGVVYNNTWDPTAGEPPTIPSSPTAFPDPIVGGNNGTASLLMAQNTIAGGLLGSSGEIDFDGYLAVPAGNVGITCEIGGSPFLALPSLGGDLLLNGLVSLHGQSPGNRVQVILNSSFGAATGGLALDLSADNDITVELDFTAANDYAVLYCYTVEVDAR